MTKTTEMTERAVGARMSDGTIYAGITADGTAEIYAMPKDLSTTMTFNDATKAVSALNSERALGHDDWQIPSRKSLRILHENQNEGALRGTFNTSGNKGSRSPCFPGWYWSSTEYRDDPSDMHDIRFSDGGSGWARKDFNRLKCRPVRVVGVKL